MKISQKKQEKICEQILAYLFQQNPKPLFTAHIASELARDEEFIKKMLLKLKAKKFILEVKKNPKGIEYFKRSRWKLTDEIYNLYKKGQENAFNDYIQLDESL
jgi:predicted transcriptional regulator